jgi:hypothetical protein
VDRWSRGASHALVVTVALGPEIKSLYIKAFGTPIFHVSKNVSDSFSGNEEEVPPSESVFSSKKSAAIIATVVSLLHVNTLMMSLQICLPHELFITVLYSAMKRIFSTRVVSFHMGFVIVASTKQLPTAFHVTLKVGVFFGS